MERLAADGRLPQYGAIVTDVEESARVRTFGRLAVGLLVVCGCVAGIGMFSLGRSTAATVVDVPVPAAATAIPGTDPAAILARQKAACPQGTRYSWDGTCHACEPGKYNDESSNNDLECTPCAAGMFTAEEGQLECTPCDAGYSQSVAGSTSCEACVPGRYQLSPGGAQCNLCGGGRFQPDSQQTLCRDCGSGTVQPEQGMTTCNHCPQGAMQPRPGKERCIKCLAGRFAAATASTSCSVCETGKIQQARGMSTCVDCEPGTFQQYPAETRCDQCAPGTFLAESGKTVCVACTTGKVQPSFGETACTDCEPGSAFAGASGTTCENCLPGQVAPASGSTECVDCVAGKVQPSGRKTTCVNCPPGAAYGRTGGTKCEDCEPGQVQPQAGSSSCVKCQEGKVGAVSKGTSCDSCPPGRVQPTLGSTQCVDCEYGKWLADAGATSCTTWTVCGTDQGVEQEGTRRSDVVCEDCLIGYISIVEDSLSACVKLDDSDGDGLFDRYIGGEVFDRREVPGTGGEYDRCPFDSMNDQDEDGICGGEVPPEEQYAHLEDAEFYPPGAWRVDECPLDPTNNRDKDLKCDNLDKEIVTFNFFSNNLVGWDSLNTLDGGEMPFEVKHEWSQVPQLQQHAFIFDRYVDDVCEKNDGVVRSVLSTDAPSCDLVCEDHGLVCEKAAALSDHTDDGEACSKEREELLAEVSCAKWYRGRRKLCQCSFDSEPIKTEQYSGDETCPTCFVDTGKQPAGSMTTDVSLKYDTVRFHLKGPKSSANFVKLAIKKENSVTRDGGNVHNMRAKATKGMPTVLATMDNYHDDEWFEVEMDVREYVGEKAVLTVQHSDPANGFSMDEVQFFNSGTGCLPSCMMIHHRVCNGGDTCFYFEEDPIPYVKVKSTSEMESGVFCRSSGDLGSELGPGIMKMGHYAHGKENWVGASMEHLGVTFLPRCVHIDMGVAPPDRNHDEPRPYFLIGLSKDDEMQFEYMPELSLDHGRKEEEEGSHCVYKTLKPRCLAYSKPNHLFSTKGRVTCMENIIEPGADISCHDQCVKMFCSTEIHGKHQKTTDSRKCGAKDGFDSCSSCCDGLNQGEGWGNCHTRRMLSEASAATPAAAAAAAAPAVAAASAVPVNPATRGVPVIQTKVVSEADPSTFTEAECAAECLSTIGCFAFDLKDGLCTLSDECDAEGDEADGFKTGKWFVRFGMTKEDLGKTEPEEPQKKKRRRKKKKSGGK